NRGRGGRIALLHSLPGKRQRSAVDNHRPRKRRRLRFQSRAGGAKKADDDAAGENPATDRHDVTPFPDECAPEPHENFATHETGAANILGEPWQVEKLT